MLKKFYSLLLLSALLLFAAACGDDDTTETPGFDRAAMLESMATSLIIPNFESLQGSVNQLAEATNAFVDNTSEANLTALQTAWVQAAMHHQHCSAFGFGPASLPLGSYDDVLGIFPVDEQQVEVNMEDPTFSLSASFDRDVRGFYAVEFLIYGDDLSNAEIIAGFDQSRKDYLLLIVDELKLTFDTIVTEWNTTYLQEFVSNDGTSAGSSISLLYNQFVKDYENLKNFKVELPAGLTAGQAEADGSLVEAYYSGISRDLIMEHFESSKNVWSGVSRDGQNIIGFEEYLVTVVGGQELVSATNEAIAAIDIAISNLPQGRLSEQVTSPEVETLRDQLQNNTPNFKSSMSSLLGISITFNSGDGD